MKLNNPILLSFITILIWLIPIGNTHGNTIGHVNIGRVAVENQSFRSQQIGGEKALEQVFVKVSGNPSILNNDTIKKAVDNFEQYMVASSFNQIDEQLFFEARFNQQKIESLLMASGLPVWTNIRPNTTLWLAYSPSLSNEISEQVVVSQNVETELKQAVKQASFSRGVDVVIPLGDFEDATNVSYFDVANHLMIKVRDSSIRYGTDYFISASLQKIDAQKAQLAQSLLLEEREKIAINEDVSAAAINGELVQDSISTPFLDDALIAQDNISENEMNLQTNVNDNILFVDPIQGSNSSQPTMSIKSLADVTIPDDAEYKLDYVIAKSTDFSFNLKARGRLYSSSDNNLLNQLINIYANLIATEFSLTSAGDDTDISDLKIDVANIDSLQDYIEVVELLTSIPAITSVSLISQSGTNSRLLVDQSIAVAQLVSILSLDNRVSLINSKLDDTNTIFINWLK